MPYVTCPACGWPPTASARTTARAAARALLAPWRAAAAVERARAGRLRRPTAASCGRSTSPSVSSRSSVAMVSEVAHGRETVLWTVGSDRFPDCAPDASAPLERDRCASACSPGASATSCTDNRRRARALRGPRRRARDRARRLRRRPAGRDRRAPVRAVLPGARGAPRPQPKPTCASSGAWQRACARRSTAERDGVPGRKRRGPSRSGCSPPRPAPKVRSRLRRRASQPLGLALCDSVPRLPSTYGRAQGRSRGRARERPASSAFSRVRVGP